MRTELRPDTFTKGPTKKDMAEPVPMVAKEMNCEAPNIWRMETMRLSKMTSVRFRTRPEVERRAVRSKEMPPPTTSR